MIICGDSKSLFVRDSRAHRTSLKYCLCLAANSTTLLLDKAVCCCPHITTVVPVDVVQSVEGTGCTPVARVEYCCNRTPAPGIRSSQICGTLSRCGKLTLRPTLFSLRLAHLHHRQTGPAGRCRYHSIYSQGASRWSKFGEHL